MEGRAHTPFQQKWVTKLLGFDYEIQYKKGCDNQAANALSRVSLGIVSSQTIDSIGAISYPYSSWLDDLRRHTENDSWIIAKSQQLLQSQCDNVAIGILRFHLDNGFLKYKHIIVSSLSSHWRDKVFTEFHSSPADFQSMKKDIKRKVASYVVCQQNKYETLSPTGLLQPLPIPSKVWSDISMDFITNLPSCKGKTLIWVVVDRLSKYAHFTALNHPYLAFLVAQLFVENIFKLHGMPQSIVNDRDPVFLWAIPSIC